MAGDYQPLKCRSCGREIKFVKIGWDKERNKAKSAPVEPKPLGVHTQKIGDVWEQRFLWEDHRAVCSGTGNQQGDQEYGS